MRLSKALSLIDAQVCAVLDAIETKMDESGDVKILGRTHGQPAETMILKHKFRIWHDEICRSLTRLKAARAEIMVGKLSGPLGNYMYEIRPADSSSILEVCGLELGTTTGQAIPRDRHAFLISTLE